MKRVYCNGTLTKATLAAELDEGFVCVDVVRKGQGGRNDVAYFREGTPEEIALARDLMAKATC